MFFVQHHDVQVDSYVTNYHWQLESNPERRVRLLFIIPKTLYLRAAFPCNVLHVCILS